MTRNDTKNAWVYKHENDPLETTKNVVQKDRYIYKVKDGRWFYDWDTDDRAALEITCKKRTLIALKTIAFNKMHI